MYVNGGSDYLDGEYRLLWSVDGSFDTAQMATLTTGTVAVGTRAVSVQFTVPESKMGYHYIRFLRVPSGQTYDTSFNVKPAMRLFPLQGKPGTPLMVHGSGFPSGDSGNILFNGAGTSVDYTANAVGSFAAQFTIPSAVSPGEYKIGAVSSRLNEDGLAYVLVVSGYQPPPTTPPETTPPPTPPPIVPPAAPPRRRSRLVPNRSRSRQKAKISASSAPSCIHSSGRRHPVFPVSSQPLRSRPIQISAAIPIILHRASPGRAFPLILRPAPITGGCNRLLPMAASANGGRGRTGWRLISSRHGSMPLPAVFSVLSCCWSSSRC